MKVTAHRIVSFAFLLSVPWFLVSCSARRTSQPAPPSPQSTATPTVTPASQTARETSAEPQVPATPVIAERPEESSLKCELVPGEGEFIATVALNERVDPLNAPHPTNTSERLIFRQLYETLVRADCEGNVVAGLASSWLFNPDTGVWFVKLRADARFSDGSPVTAADIVSAWTVEGDAEAVRPPYARLIHSVRAADDRTIEIALRSRRTDVPMALGHPDLAIVKRQAGAAWPLGTRASRILPETQQAPRGVSSVITLTHEISSGSPEIPETSGNPPSVRFLIAPGRDGRDFLDDGVDLLLTRDPRTLDYAATLPRFTAVPLAWQRTEVLLSPGRGVESSPLSEEARESLAREAVRGEARGAQGPFWWQALSECEMDLTPARNVVPSTNGRVVYDTGDSAARDLAERLVGLVRASGPSAAAVLDALLPDRSRRTFQRAVGLSGDALATARRRGEDAAYIMALDRPLDPCWEMRALMDSAGWVEAETIVPLVDTRLQAIVQRGHSGVVADWDGGLLLHDGRK